MQHINQTQYAAHSPCCKPVEMVAVNVIEAIEEDDPVDIFS